MKLLMDLDCGVDDAHALMLALSCPEVEVLAITCAGGNTSLDHVCRNTLRVLKLCGRLDIPVYRGQSSSIDGRKKSTTDFHGTDGFGDTENDDVDMSLIRTDTAAEAMVRIADTHPGEVILFASAPLTNPARALQLDPAFGRKLKSATIMGGNISGIGNFKIASEFNFSIDPVAAYTVLEELKCPINLLTLETSIDHGLSMEWVQSWTAIDTPRGRLNRRITRLLIDNMAEETLGKNTFVLYDAMAMATLLYPQSVLEKADQYCIVELAGTYTKGMMVVDWHGHLQRPPNVSLIRKMDVEFFAEILERSMRTVD